jgi:16S rRNA (guanine527-N7)-methyltransferase
MGLVVGRTPSLYRRGAATHQDPQSHPVLANISSEIRRRLEIYSALLTKWQRVLNLVSPGTLGDVWLRHFADSWQVSDAVPHARVWMDLGSGAGFPGLVTAIRYADEPGAKTHLIESDQRKCAFLREVSRETGAGATIHCGRIENIVPEFQEPIEAVSARALASLPVLLDYAAPLLARGAVAVFSKGKQFPGELTESLTAGKYLISTIESRTEASARLVIVRRRSLTPTSI